MGVLDKFLDIMKLGDEDDYDDDYFDDEYEDDFEEKPKKSFLKREKKYEADLDEELESLPATTSRSSRSNKVTPMRQPQRKAASAMEVCVIKPNTVEDAREITET